MIRTFLCVLLLVGGGAASAADLLDVYRLARSSDPTYSAARGAWAAAQERIPQARAGLLPLASVSASAQYNDRTIVFRDDTVQRSKGTFGSTGLSLSVSQPLYRKQNGIVYDQALTQVEQADAQLALSAQDLILRSAQSYFDILLAYDNVALAQAQKTAIGQQLEQAKRNFDVGTATITDTHEAQARYDLTGAQEIAARNDLELRRRALEQLIGRSTPPVAPLGPRFTMQPPEPAAMDPWVSLARRSNLQVRVAQSASTFAAQEIDRNRAAHRPTVDAFVTLSNSGAGAGTAGGIGNDTRSSVVGVQLAMPIYQGGLVNSRVREAIANQSRAGDDLEAARRNAEFNARQAFLGITSGIAQVRALEAALVSTNSQLESTRVGQEVGVRTQVDVLNAQQLLYSAQRDLAQSRYTYVLSLLRLEAAIGELTEEDLVPINAWLDSTRSAEDGPPMPASAPPDDAAPVKAAPGQPPQRTSKPAASAPEGGADVIRTVQDWARAWAANDVTAYLSHYAPDFEPPRAMSRSAWEAERRSRIQKPRAIEVEIDAPTVRLEGADRAQVAFRQRYRSGTLDLVTDKTLVMVRRGERWLVQQEKVTSESPQAVNR
ncbi:MAG: type secretion outer membrane protein TolC family [Betaproteobacteria bacterium]|nr:type secretion outer membrane protein TolC family [Betaproteobacteria bacterium]